MGSLIHQLSCSHKLTRIYSISNSCWSNAHTMNPIPVFICSLFSLAFSCFSLTRLIILSGIVCAHWTSQQCTNGHIQGINGPHPRGRKQILFFQLFSQSSQFRCGFCVIKFCYKPEDVHPGPPSVWYERMWILFYLCDLISGKHSKWQFFANCMNQNERLNEWMCEWMKKEWSNGLFRLSFFIHQAWTKNSFSIFPYAIFQ